MMKDIKAFPSLFDLVTAYLEKHYGDVSVAVFFDVGVSADMNTLKSIADVSAMTTPVGQSTWRCSREHT